MTAARARSQRIPSRVVLAGVAAVVVGVAVAAPATGAAAQRVLVQIGTVLATNSGEHVDTQLAGMRQQLVNVFPYTSYRLVKRESRDVAWGDPVDVEIPGGRFLEVRPTAASGDRVSLNVMLRRDSRVLMDTEFTLSPRGTVMVGGPRHDDGVLIIWIGAQPVSDAKQGGAR